MRRQGRSHRQESPDAGDVAGHCLFLIFRGTGVRRHHPRVAFIRFARLEESLTKFLRTGIYPIAALLLLLSLAAPAAADMDGVMMHGGKMMMMKAGRPATAMDHEVTMSDGTVVEVDGTVKRKDGKEFHLQNGEMIMMDGHLMKGGKATPMSQ